MSISPLRSSSCSRWRHHQLPLLFLLLQSEHPSSVFPQRPPPSSARHFSHTSPCSSRTGATPISVPAEVRLRLRPPKPRKVITRIQPNQVLEVEGPLGGFFVFNLSFLEEWIDPGEIWGQAGEKKNANVGVVWCIGKTSLELPAYMDFAQDQNTGKALLKIPDRTVRKHREMWGMFCSKSSTVLLDSYRAKPYSLRLHHRNHTGLSPKPHPGSF